MTNVDRWVIEQVAAVAPSPAALLAAEPLATRDRWSALGGDDRALWGRCRGSSGEPYDVAVDHVEVATRCTCPSRRSPCKHALALLMLWVREGLPAATAPSSIRRWLDRPVSSGARIDSPTAGARPTGTAPTSGDPSDPGGVDGAAPPPDRESGRDDRVARMRDGLLELDRWLEDRVRTGLADPALARYSTWDELAARLVDARAGALANRVRRLAGAVGATPDWHSRVLAEIGVLHLLVQAGLRIGSLPDHLADAVGTATGWQVRTADVLAGVPETDTWIVAGRSDTREDRIEVRRVWLRGAASGRWAMILSFAAYRQSLDSSLTVGTAVTCDVHRYPGNSLRALIGVGSGEPPMPHRPAPPAVPVGAACDQLGRMLAAEPWSDRVPATVLAAPSMLAGRWVLTDRTGSLPLHADAEVAMMLASSEGRPVPITFEWTSDGAVPLTVHLDDRALDIGPVADPSFVGAR